MQVYNIRYVCTRWLVRLLFPTGKSPSTAIDPYDQPGNVLWQNLSRLWSGLRLSTDQTPRLKTSESYQSLKRLLERFERILHEGKKQIPRPPKRLPVRQSDEDSLPVRIDIHSVRSSSLKTKYTLAKTVWLRGFLMRSIFIWNPTRTLYYGAAGK